MQYCHTSVNTGTERPSSLIPYTHSSQSFNVVSWELTPNLICMVFSVACHCFEFWAYVSVIYKEEVLCYSALQDGGGVSPHKKRRYVA